MSFESRLDTLQEKGNTFAADVRTLTRKFLSYMWPPPAAPDPRTAVVEDYVFASAVYEWAAINMGDRVGDREIHKLKGPGFESTVGKGASIGPFQGYAKESYLALRKHAGLRKELRARVADFAKAIPDSFDDPPPPGPVLVYYPGARRGRIPGPAGTPVNVRGMGGGPEQRVLVGEEDRRLRQYLSDYDHLDNYFVSLIGKMQLSVEYAEEAMRYRAASGSPTGVIWRLPDAALRYALLSFEVSGGDGDYLKRVADAIDKATAGTAASFQFSSDRIKQTYSRLGLAWSSQCRLDELRKA